MNCPQCNNDVPEGSVFCPRCGASTRPAAFSYLPRGVPAWPTGVGERPAYATATDTMAGPPTTAFSSEKVTPRQPKSAGAILSIVAAVILIPLFGAAATFGILWANGSLAAKAPQAAAHVVIPTPNALTPTPATGATPSTQTGQLPNPTSFAAISSASSKALGIQLKIPSDWTETPPSAPASNGLITADFHPQQQLGIDISINRVPIQAFGSTSTTSDINQAILQSFSTAQGVSNFTPVTTKTPQQTIGGTQWDEQDATFAGPSNTIFQFSAITVKHKTWYFSFIYYTPQQFYSEAQTKYITPIFGSFQFIA